MENAQRQKLPEVFRPLFWSYDFDALDLDTDKKIIVLNVINYGNLEHWQWINGYYGSKGVREILEKVPATEIKKRSGRLAELLFDLKLNHAPRGAH